MFYFNYKVFLLLLFVSPNLNIIMLSKNIATIIFWLIDRNIVLRIYYSRSYVEFLSETNLMSIITLWKIGVSSRGKSPFLSILILS